jgi:hypothetical protein
VRTIASATACGGSERAPVARLNASTRASLNGVRVVRGCDVLDAYLRSGELSPQRLGEAAQSELARAVDGKPRHAEPSERGAYVQDACLRHPDELRQQRTRELDRRDQVRREYAFDASVFGIRERAEIRRAGALDQRVDAPHAGERDDVGAT